MGRTTGNGWFYIPDYGEHGPAAYAAFASAMDAADELLGTMNLAPAHKHATLWASDGSPQAVTVDAAGNVGIGTPTPEDTLNVNGSVRAGVGAVGKAILVAETGSQAGHLDIYKGDGSTRLGYIGYDNNNMGYVALVGDHIFTGGNVGIGVASFGTSAAKVLGIGTGTAPTTAPADMAQMWVEDVNAAAGFAGLHKRTETTNQKEIVPGVIIYAGDPPNPYEGLMCINTTAHKVKMYAEGGWRELGW